MYFVLHSTDPYLLARMCTDLQGEEYGTDEFCDYVRDYTSSLIIINKFTNYFWFTQYEDVANPIRRFTLTSKNYLKVLETILESKKR